MSQTVVSSWNDFDPLRHIILGRADHTCIPPTEPATEAKIPEDSPMRGRWGPRPLETVERANEQLEHFAAVLEGRGIRVDRPDPIQWNQAVVTPDFSTSCMFGCMPPRDVLLTVGREILSAPMSFRCRYFEYLAYHPLMQRYFDEDPEFRWEQAPRPGSPAIPTSRATSTRSLWKSGSAAPRPSTSSPPSTSRCSTPPTCCGSAGISSASTVSPPTGAAWSGCGATIRSIGCTR